MTLTDEQEPATQVASNRASRAAARNWAANMAALCRSQPTLATRLDAPLAGRTWFYGRDGALTIRDAAGRWQAGCSLPLRAGRAMLKRLELRGVVGCLLAPSHAGQVVAGLERINATQAIVVIQPDLDELRVMLACQNFASEIERHRLWLAAGEAWAARLTQIFDDALGLPTPTQFIRLPVTPEEVSSPLIAAAQRVFEQVNAARAAQIVAIQSKSPAAHRGRILLVAPTHFRLWDDTGPAILTALGGADCVTHLDPDDPTQASALGFALAAQSCDAVVVANRGRNELPEVLRDGATVVSWITCPRVPPFDPRHSQDSLLLAEPAWEPTARSAGWPKERIGVAGWPGASLPSSVAGSKYLAIIADTSALDIPTKELEFSTHHLLWESIRAEISENPLCFGRDAGRFVDARREASGISAEGFDRELFVQRLVIPAYQQALAQRLIAAGLPLRIHGRGWETVDGVADALAGPVLTRTDFHTAAAAATCLVYAWPTREHHPIDSLGKPVLDPPAASVTSWLRTAAAAVAGNPPAAQTIMRPLDTALIRQLAR